MVTLGAGTCRGAPRCCRSVVVTLLGHMQRTLMLRGCYAAASSLFKGEAFTLRSWIDWDGGAAILVEFSKATG